MLRSKAKAMTKKFEDEQNVEGVALKEMLRTKASAMTKEFEN